MSSYDWDEVKRLAADFQRAQNVSNLQKLTENNCVEIVTKLVKMKLLDVLFTTDGKTYVTPSHLKKEILDELYVNGGRVNLVDIAKSLSMDLNVIQNLSREVVKEEQDVRLLLGQLINGDYVKQMAEEINEKLQQRGLLSINELTHTWDLPPDFIHSIMKDHIGGIIQHTKQDKHESHIYYTDSFVARNRAIIRGALLAVTRPTLISAINAQCSTELPEKTFISVIESMISSEAISGSLVDKNVATCAYIPAIYLKCQTEWVQNFYKQNGYIEFSSLNKRGISDCQAFINNVISDELQYLRNYAVGPIILDQVEGALEEAMTSHIWIDVMTLLPSSFEPEDAEIALDYILKKIRAKTNVHIFYTTFVVSDSYVENVKLKIMEKITPVNIDKALSSGTYEKYILESKAHSPIATNNGNRSEVVSKKEERKKKAASGKSGGGTQGRETKTKSVKKKYGKKAFRNESDEEIDANENDVAFELISRTEITDFICEECMSDADKDCDYSEFIEELANYLYPILNTMALGLIQDAYRLMKENESSGGSRKKLIAELEDRMHTLFFDFRQFGKALRYFENTDAHAPLVKYLLKNTGGELANASLLFVCNKSDLNVVTSEDRLKAIATIESKIIKEICAKLNKAVSGNSIEQFSEAMDELFDKLQIMPRKIGKHKEQILLKGHKQALFAQMNESVEPALVLQLASLILFQTVTNCMLNASGRFVPDILHYVRTQLSPEIFAIINHYHESVTKLLRTEKDNEEENVRISAELEEKTEELKRLMLVVPVSRHIFNRHHY